MKANQFIKNQEADVLGLPMYLIIVMIIAVAVIAAVIYMIPTGTKTLQAVVTEGAAFTAAVQGDGTATVTPAADSIKVSLYTNDERRDPITGASVTVIGLGTTIAFTEQATIGTYHSQVAVDPVRLAPHANQGYLTLIVRAPGFENFEDTRAIMIVRGN
jgi:hypothetical protein